MPSVPYPTARSANAIGNAYLDVATNCPPPTAAARSVRGRQPALRHWDAPSASRSRAGLGRHHRSTTALLVIGFAGNHVPHAAARILARIRPWDDIFRPQIACDRGQLPLPRQQTRNLPRPLGLHDPRPRIGQRRHLARRCAGLGHREDRRDGLDAHLSVRLQHFHSRDRAAGSQAAVDSTSARPSR